MNDSVYNAKRAILGRGNYKMTDFGCLLNLDTGRDGIRHIPKGCKAIDSNIFSAILHDVTYDAEIRFCESAEIRVDGGGILKVKPYNANKISDILLDLRYATDVLWSYRLIFRLKNVRVRYIFSAESFAQQVAKLYYCFQFSEGIGWKITKKKGKLAVFIGTTDITKEFYNNVIWRNIVSELGYSRFEEFKQKLRNDIEKMEIETTEDFFLTRGIAVKDVV